MATAFSCQELKDQVREFWNARSCGEAYAQGLTELERLDEHSRRRYELEPYLLPFARFDQARGRDVLEIGVGMGADHLQLARQQPRFLAGIDLTSRAIEHTRARLQPHGLVSQLQTADAEHLPFPDDAFDFVYSWGVLHHSPDTAAAVSEIHRVLRPGGVARVMIYHKWSLAGYLLWMRYALLRGKPHLGLDEIYHHHLESPGTKAYSVEQAREMFRAFSDVSCRVQLSFGELLQGQAGQRHRSPLLALARRLWPRPLIRFVFRNHGLDLLIEARKAGGSPSRYQYREPPVSV
jgi:ubiquinone/menaquinone biosynthesis C-methylase UbiE